MMMEWCCCAAINPELFQDVNNTLGREIRAERESLKSSKSEKRFLENSERKTTLQNGGRSFLSYR
jgi:hypothetical protein